MIRAVDTFSSRTVSTALSPEPRPKPSRSSSTEPIPNSRAAAAALLFGIGSVLLLRDGFGRGSGDSAVDTVRDENVSTARIMGISFGVLFAAEWGDASQLASAALTARSGAPLTVGIGAWLALVTVAGIAVLVGNRISGHLPARWLQRTAGVLFAVFALVAAYEAVLG